MTRRARAGGFTLVEILVALGIMAFGVTVALGLFTLATRTHKRALDRTNAGLVAESAMAELRSTLTATSDLSGLASAGGASVYLRRGGSYPGHEDYAYDLVLTPLDGDTPDEADTFLAEVTVRWRATGKARTQVYSTVVVRRLAARDL